MANNFEVIETGDYVLCAVSKKEIPLDKLTYWNVELQEAYFSRGPTVSMADLLSAGAMPATLIVLEYNGDSATLIIAAFADQGSVKQTTQ